MPNATVAVSRNFDDYAEILQGLEHELGAAFSTSIVQWCGREPRTNALDVWEIYLIKADDKTVGITGLYRRPGEEPNMAWLGWLGVLPEHRKKGYARAALKLMERRAHQLGCEVLFVYTERNNQPAQALYESAGFTWQYDAGDLQSSRSADPSEYVYALRLSHSAGVLKRFPRRIAVIIAESKQLETPALPYLILYLNQLQPWFQYELFSSTHNDDLIGDLQAGVTVDRALARARLPAFWDRFWLDWMFQNADNGTKESVPDYVVVISLAKFSEEYYTMRSGRVSVLGLGNWEAHLAPPSILEFLLTLLIRESFAAVSPSLAGSVHIGTKGCVCDFTSDLQHARYKVLGGFICAFCRGKLERDGLPAELANDLEPVLQGKWLGKTDDPSSPAGITAALGFDLFRTRGFRPTAWQRLFTNLEDEGVKEFIKLIFLIIGTALLVKLGLEKS